MIESGLHHWQLRHFAPLLLSHLVFSHPKRRELHPSLWVFVQEAAFLSFRRAYRKFAAGNLDHFQDNALAEVFAEMARLFFLTRYYIPVLVQRYGFIFEVPDGAWRRDACRQFAGPCNLGGADFDSFDGASAGAPAADRAHDDKREVDGHRYDRQRQRRAYDDRLRRSLRRGDRNDARARFRFAEPARSFRDARM